jgi:hypothetical protein
VCGWLQDSHISYFDCGLLAFAFCMVHAAFLWRSRSSCHLPLACLLLSAVLVLPVVFGVSEANEPCIEIGI